MDSLFTILKFVGAFVSGFGAVIAAIPDEKRSKHIDKSKLRQGWRTFTTKQWGLNIAIFGLFVAMLSQFAETQKASRENKEAQTKYVAQMNVATNSLMQLERQGREIKKQLAYLNHLAGEFDTLTIEVFFELISTNSSALLLTERVAEIAGAFIDTSVTNKNGTNIVTGVFSLPSFVGAATDTEKLPRGKQLPIGSKQSAAMSGVKMGGGTVYAGNAVGYVNLYSPLTNADPKRLIHEQILSWYGAGFGSFVENGQVFSSNWLAGVSSNTNLMKLIDCIHLPMLGVRIFSKQTIGRDKADADFFAPPPTAGTIQPTIGYDSISHGVILSWLIEYPSSAWQQTLRMGRIQDLDAATLCFYLANVPEFVTNDFRPLVLKLKFGKSTMKVHKFDLQAYEDFTGRFDPLQYKVIGENSTNHVRVAHNKSATNRAPVYKTSLPSPSYDPIEMYLDSRAR